MFALKPTQDIFHPRRLAEEKALAVFALQVTQQCHLFELLHPFADDVHAEVVRKSRHGAHHFHRPGIMEAANRGAADVRGINIGLNIQLPFEQVANPYSTRSLTFNFHYFFMRKFWFSYFAKAMVFMPGGFGTLDEMAEILTLCQPLKLKKRMPMVLYGQDFWRRFLDLNVMIESGTISRDDLDLLHRSDTVDDALDFITSELTPDIETPGETPSHVSGTLTVPLCDVYEPAARKMGRPR